MVFVIWSNFVFGSQLEFIEGKCKHVPVPNYISQTHLYDFRLDFPTGEDIQEAHQKAIRNLVLPKCAGLSEKACFVIQSQTSVVDYIFDQNIKQICSLAMLSVETAKNPLGNDRELSPTEYISSQQETLARDVEKFFATHRISKKTSVWLQNPIVEGTECSAGMMGKHIQSLVKDELHNQQIPVSLHSSFELSSIGMQFSIGDPWSVDIFYQDTTGTTMLISHLEIPSVYMPPNSQACLDAQSLGLDHVNSNPALRYEINLEKNVFCEGDMIHPIIRTSAPSQMVVLSLLADGSTYLIWPSVGVERRITSEIDLGSFEAVPGKFSGEERLIVIGIPEDEKFGIFSNMNSFCSLSNWQQYVPKKASIKTLSYQILPSGVGGCSYENVDAQKRFHYTRTLDRVQECR